MLVCWAVHVRPPHLCISRKFPRRISAGYEPGATQFFINFNSRKRLFDRPCRVDQELVDIGPPNTILFAFFIWSRREGYDIFFRDI
jgi:hypothetical protein